MITDPHLAMLDRIETALTAAIVELIRQRNDIRRERALLSAAPTYTATVILPVRQIATTGMTEAEHAASRQEPVKKPAEEIDGHHNT